MAPHARLRRSVPHAVSAMVLACALVPIASAESTASAPAVRSVAKQPVFLAAHARYGIKGSPSVRRLQRALISKKYATVGLRRAGATGAYLAQTRASVANVQRRLGFNGADADGIIGASSARHLGLEWRSVQTQTPPAPSAPNSPSSPGAKLSPTELKSVLLQAGFREPAIRTAWAVAMRESGGYPAIVSPKNSNGTRDHGLFQFNDVHRSYIDFSRIYQPVFNAQTAYSMSRGGADWGAWGLGETGWAGQLKKQSPATWAMLRDRMLEWRARYPG